MVIFASLILSTVLSVTIQDPTPVSKDRPEQELTQPLQEILTNLNSVDIKLRQQAMQAILLAPDPALLPFLKKNLNDPDPSNRRQLTMLILRAFPDHCFEYFKELLSNEGIHRREAASHALGYIQDMRVLPLLKSALEDSEEKIQLAALRGLQSLARIDLPMVFKRVTGQPTTNVDETSSIRSEACAVLNLAGLSNPGNLNLQIARLRCLDSASARQNRTAWLDSLSANPITQTSCGGIFEANGKWLGRCAVAKPLQYQFSMLNAVSGTSKEISISANAADIDSLRSLDYDLDRAIHLRLASDLFFNIPAVLNPTIQITDESIDIDFIIEGYPFRHAGVGMLNISYWESRIQQGHSAHLRFDPVTHRLLDETIKDSEGKTLWFLTTPSWLPGPDDFPNQIDIDIPGGNIGAKLSHMKMTLKFQLHLSSWLLQEAQATQVMPGDDELRAYCEIDPVPVSEK